MAKITGSLDRALLRYPDSNLSKFKLIGWGGGQFFRDYYPIIKDKINLEYTICPLPENQGLKIHGIDVRSPSVLHSENHHNTLILVFAGHVSEVMSQISYGEFKRFRVMWALNFDIKRSPLIDELQEQRELLALGMKLKKPSRKNTKFGIFYQGLAFNFTPQVLAWNRLKYPAAYHCMATWNHQPKKILDQCRPWLDKLILIPEPDGNKGIKNLNYVIRSARHGIEHLSEMNIDFSIRCRSDNIIIGDSINHATEELFGGGRNKGKIAIDLLAGWQYIPFHFSEKLMLARTEDMLQLWSVPEDERTGAQLPPSNPDGHFQQLANRTAEAFIWKNYAKELGFPTDSLKDSYSFARLKLEAINPYLQWFSFKFIPVFSILRDTRMNFSEERWNEILHDIETSNEVAEDISRLDMTERDFWQRKIG